LSKGWTAFFCLLAILIGLPSGAAIGYYHIDNDVSDSVSQLSQDVPSFLADKTNAAENFVVNRGKQEVAKHVQVLQGPYIHIQSNQLAVKSPLIGPIDKIKDRVSWKAQFVAYLKFVNQKRAFNGKKQLVAFPVFVEPDPDKTSSAKDWSAKQAGDWVNDHS